MATIHVYHFAPRFAETIAEALRGRGHEVVACNDDVSFRDALPIMEVLVTQRPPRGHWHLAEKLRLIHGLGAGVDDLFPSPDLPARVVICNARGVMAPEVSEYAIAMMLALERALPTTFARQREREWTMFPVGRLEGRTVGIVGVGAIGSRVARIASAMGMTVIGTVRKARILESVTIVPLEELLERSDHVVVTLPRTPQTIDLIDPRRMKQGAYVIAVGRGGVINEQHLMTALREGHLGGAALDVFVDEPLPADSPWWTAPNTIVTPHTAGLGRNYLERTAAVILDNVGRMERGQELVCQVDRALGY
jgi:phosphoglycerate dehydrogenase-like enzyme